MWFVPPSIHNSGKRYEWEHGRSRRRSSRLRNGSSISSSATPAATATANQRQHSRLPSPAVRSRISLRHQERGDRQVRTTKGIDTIRHSGLLALRSVEAAISAKWHGRRSSGDDVALRQWTRTRSSRSSPISLKSMVANRRHAKPRRNRRHRQHLRHRGNRFRSRLCRSRSGHTSGDQRRRSGSIEPTLLRPCYRPWQRRSATAGRSSSSGAGSSLACCGASSWAIPGRSSLPRSTLRSSTFASGRRPRSRFIVERSNNTSGTWLKHGTKKRERLRRRS